MSHDIEKGNINEYITKKCISFVKYEWNKTKKTIAILSCIGLIFYAIQYSLLNVYNICFIDKSINNCKDNPDFIMNIFIAQIITFLCTSFISLMCGFIYFICQTIRKDYNIVRKNKLEIDVNDLILFIKYDMNNILIFLLIIVTLYVNFNVILYIEPTLNDKQIKLGKSKPHEPMVLFLLNLIINIFTFIVYMLIYELFTNISKYYNESWKNYEFKY